MWVNVGAPGDILELIVWGGAFDTESFGVGCVIDLHAYALSE